MTLLTRLFKAPRPSGEIPIIDLLSRPGCHLCDEARYALSREIRRVQIRTVDITQDQALEDEYVFRIPVVLHRGDVLAEGIIDRPVARRVKHELRRRMKQVVEPT